LPVRITSTYPFPKMLPDRALEGIFSEVGIAPVQHP
jgi:hypothetical protein